MQVYYNGTTVYNQNISDGTTNNYNALILDLLLRSYTSCLTATPKESHCVASKNFGVYDMTR